MKHNLKYFFWKVWFSGTGSRMWLAYLLITVIHDYYETKDSGIPFIGAVFILLFILIKTAIWYLRGAKIDEEN
ncbi:hypothetical protein [Enterococcus cecorum]|uniref:hypothetical protein n=1 Tax=Enterococcus cecorum TaxID=44008 RepID=UPI001FABD6C1|nr:hypothetical protein [Enterococcus cecorum]MCJ0537961.1 hypothetical protein [Enterococcus cecorum]MCJ0569557.1 hypothetical protein [Enterococcus cecorum]